jgi:uncharacterized protein YndB with AHSA1/START domain
MRSDGGTRQGYLLLADISGYTAFLTGTELEHAQAIIHELTSLIREKLAPPMGFVKLEGDAVFCYAEAQALRDGERFVELIEACYFDFSNRLQDMARATTCRCDACAAIPTLGLKFVAHYGTFVVVRDSNLEDLAGPDVILVHRLLKNSVSENGGPEAYAFLTNACRSHLPPSFKLPEHSETYDSFGETRGGVHDLAPVLAAMREARSEYISPEEADYEFTLDMPVPPAVAWQYWVDPIERQRWACRQFGKDPDQMDVNAQGRYGTGLKMHCGHGPGSTVREFVDWRPFSYFTCRNMTPMAGAWVKQRPAIETIEFAPLGEGGTRVVARVRIVNRGRIAMLTFQVTKPAIAAFLRRFSAALLSIIEEDVATLGLDEPGRPEDGLNRSLPRG